MTVQSGQKPTAAELNALATDARDSRARGIIGRTKETTDQLVANVIGDQFLVGTVSCTIEPGRWLEITGDFCASSAVANDNVRIEVCDEVEGTPLGGKRATIAANDAFAACPVSAVIDTDDYTEGFQTFYFYAVLLSGTGPAGYIASATEPAEMLVRDLGPSS